MSRKTDWENKKKPIFNSSKLAVVKPNPDEAGGFMLVNPGDNAFNPEKASEMKVEDEQGRILGLAAGYMPHFIDGSDAMANKGMIVSFQHVPSKEDVNFKAFITAFNETYNCDWTSETVFGRADPIHMFKNTTREITIALNVPAASEGEAFENLGRVQRLVTFLYPSYSGDKTSTDKVNQPDALNALTISNSPLVRLRVMNLLAARPQIGDAKGDSRSGEKQTFSTLGTFKRHVEDGGASEWPTTSGGSNKIAGNYHGGILGVIKNLTVNHNLENPDHGVFEINQGTILPKMIEINLTFGVIHEHSLGWLPDGDTQSFSNQLFPYGINDAEIIAGSNTLPDIEDLKNQNNMAIKSITGSLDQLVEEVDQHDQDIANAEARYAGLFGKARFNKDLKKGRYKDNPYIASAVRGRQTMEARPSDKKIDSRNTYRALNEDGVIGSDETFSSAAVEDFVT